MSQTLTYDPDLTLEEQLGDLRLWLPDNGSATLDFPPSKAAVMTRIISHEPPSEGNITLTY